MNKKILYTIFISFFAIAIFSFTSKKKFEKKNAFGQLVIHFIHCVNGQPVKFNQLIYTDKAGNQFMIKQLQYFVSEITLRKRNGILLPFNIPKRIYYVDNELPKTNNLTIPIETESDSCDGICFRFGIAKEKNKSNLFKNPPYNLMAWPDQMGGGYHYMKLNLKYLNNQKQLSNFCCHLGLGKTNDSDTASVIDNSFPVVVSSANPFVFQSNNTTEIWLEMDIAKWFDGKYCIDMNKYDGIMDNQNAMYQFCNNGSQAFSLKVKQ